MKKLRIEFWWAAERLADELWRRGVPMRYLDALCAFTYRRRKEAERA